MRTTRARRTRAPRAGVARHREPAANSEVGRIDHVAGNVSDLKRSSEFYQRVFCVTINCLGFSGLRRRVQLIFTGIVSDLLCAPITYGDTSRAAWSLPPQKSLRQGRDGCHEFRGIDRLRQMHSRVRACRRARVESCIGPRAFSSVKSPTLQVRRAAPSQWATVRSLGRAHKNAEARLDRVRWPVWMSASNQSRRAFSVDVGQRRTGCRSLESDSRVIILSGDPRMFVV